MIDRHQVAALINGVPSDYVQDMQIMVLFGVVSVALVMLSLTPLFQLRMIRRTTTLLRYYAVSYATMFLLSTALRTF